jgi:peptidoglycan/LPS O-acetylase OafA/YrhL
MAFVKSDRSSGEEAGVTFQERLVLTSFRGPGFDHIRLAAATIVLLHHCRGLQYPDIQNDPLMHYTAGFMDFGRFAVVIFFAVSGFLVTPGLLRAGGLIDYTVSRTTRIFPGLIVNVILSMLVLGPIFTTYSIEGYFTSPQLYLYAKNILTLMVNFLPGVDSDDGSPVIVNGALWTLHFEILCYIALMLASVLALLTHRIRFLALWCALYAIYIAISLNPAIASGVPGRFPLFISLFVYFGYGVVLYLYRERIPFSATLAGAALGLLLIGLPLGAGAVVMPICLPYIVIFGGLSFLPGKALLRHDLSYGLYLIHAPILVSFRLLFPNMHIWWIGALIVFLVTLVLAYASWIFVESPAVRRKKEIANWIRQRMQPRNRQLSNKGNTQREDRSGGDIPFEPEAQSN